MYTTNLPTNKMLKRLKILITRPKHQTEKLSAAIQKQGGIAISFPTLEIKAVNTNNALNYLENIKHYNFIIFLSPNAVVTTTTYIQKIYPVWPAQTKIIAIGPGTANALQQKGLPVDYFPEKNFSSEGLLALLPFQHPKQKKILILQGENGRGYLDKALEKKGAHVTTVNVYQRQCPQVAKTCIPYPSVNVIVCTSNEGLKNLVTLLHPHWHTALFAKQLLVVSPRIADYAKKLGFVKSPLISDNASNEAILQTLLAYAKGKL